MRKDNTIFFVTGLAFGVVIGYFVFQSAIGPPGVAVSAAPSAAAPSGKAAAPRAVLDRREIEALERIAEENPGDAEVRIRIGTLYAEAGQDREAVRWFRQAIETDPENLHARSHLALSLANLGMADEAIGQFQAALELDPTHPQSLLGLGRVKLYVQKDIRGGLEAWEKLMKLAPDSPEAASIRDELAALKSAHSGS